MVAAAVEQVSGMVIIIIMTGDLWELAQLVLKLYQLSNVPQGRYERFAANCISVILGSLAFQRNWWRCIDLIFTYTIIDNNNQNVSPVISNITQRVTRTTNIAHITLQTRR